MDQGSKQKRSWDVLSRFFPFVCIRHELHKTFHFRQDRSSLSKSPPYVHRMEMFVPFVALLRESSFVSHWFGGTCGRRDAATPTVNTSTSCAWIVHLVCNPPDDASRPSLCPTRRAWHVHRDVPTCKFPTHWSNRSGRRFFAASKTAQAIDVAARAKRTCVRARLFCSIGRGNG